MRTTCPACRARLGKTWHLVCPACWAKLSKPVQDRLYDLWRRKRGSPEHRQLCATIVRELIQKRRAA